MRVQSSLALLFCVLAPAGVALAQSPTPIGSPAVGTPAVVAVQSPGAEPRRPLRYVFIKGRQESMTMDMAMGMGMDMAGVSLPATTLPTMHMTVDATTTDVSDAGDGSVQMIVTDARWLSGPGVDPTLLAGLQSSAVDMTGLSYDYTITNRGVGLAANVDVRTISNPQVAQILNSMTSAVQSMSLPLPEESVGVGATWQVRQNLPAGGLHLDQTVQVELLAMDATSCTLRLQTTQTAPPQPVTNSALPAGVQATLDKYDGSGAGTMTIRFDSPVPTSDISARNSTTMSVDMAGRSQQIGVTVNMKTTVAPVR